MSNTRLAAIAMLSGVCVLSIPALSAVPQAPQAARPDDPKPPSAKYDTIVLRGQVTELGPYLDRALRVPMDDDAGKLVLVLVSDKGELHPLIKDIRSRGYWTDKRLRDRPVELHVHRFPGVPFLRLIDAYSLKDGKRYKIDYWCEVCSIVTYEPGPCPCCQDEIELRERPADEIKPGQ